MTQKDYIDRGRKEIIKLKQRQSYKVSEIIIKRTEGS